MVSDRRCQTEQSELPHDHQHPRNAAKSHANTLSQLTSKPLHLQTPNPATRPRNPPIRHRHPPHHHRRRHPRRRQRLQNPLPARQQRQHKHHRPPYNLRHRPSPELLPQPPKPDLRRPNHLPRCHHRYPGRLAQSPTTTPETAAGSAQHHGHKLPQPGRTPLNAPALSLPPRSPTQG